MPRLILAALVAALVALPERADAGGMFLPARGARPLGRAGAYVAGADDLEAVYYNPAGIAGTGGGSVLLDLGLVFQRVHYDRVDSGGVAQPGVDADNQLLPLPFLGVSWRPEALHKNVTFALAVWAPETGLPSYDGGGRGYTGPQRYSLVSLAGTSALFQELAVSIRLTPELYIGGGFQNLILSLTNAIALSGCTQLNCAPEDTRFDSPSQTRVASLFTPSANFGFLWVKPQFRVGASIQLPHFARMSGTVKTRLPSDAQFDGAVVVGDAIDVEMNLPAVFRAGAEVRPTRALRIEVSADYETWQLQDRLRFVPRGVYIDHVVGIGRYDLRPMELNRQMSGVFSIHLGGEWDVIPGRLGLRAGYLFETSGVPDETLAVLTPDGDKHLLAVGLSVRLGRFRLDAAYGHFIQPDRTITNSQSYQLNPIQPSLAVAVGNGTYQVGIDVLSVGMDARF